MRIPQGLSTKQFSKMTNEELNYHKEWFENDIELKKCELEKCTNVIQLWEKRLEEINEILKQRTQ